MPCQSAPVVVRRLGGVSPQGARAHAHACGQLLLIERGAVLCESEASRWLMGARQVCWIPPRLAHSALAIGDVDGLAAYVSPSHDLSGGLFGDALAVTQASALLQAALHRLLALASLQWGARQVRLMQVLADELLSVPSASFALPLPGEPRLKRLCRQILENPARPWRLDDAARQFGFSRSTLMRVFRAQTGLGFGQWLAQARLHVALQLLGAGSQVGVAALQVGYQSPSAFCAAFRRLYGMSPGAFRQAG